MSASILVVDDEEAIRELTSQLLGTLGYEVTAVPDGLEAVRLYERALRKGEHFQAVILDATVRGGMGGVATIERLRSMDRIRVCAMRVSSFTLISSFAFQTWRYDPRSRPDYLRDRDHAPRGSRWDRAVAEWQRVRSDDDAVYDDVVDKRDYPSSAVTPWACGPAPGLHQFVTG